MQVLPLTCSSYLPWMTIFYFLYRLEATYYGCFPLCPSTLVYPELYPKECLYKNEEQLLKTLEDFCKKPSLARHMRHNLKMDFKLFSADCLLSEYKHVLSPQWHRKYTNTTTNIILISNTAYVDTVWKPQTHATQSELLIVSLHKTNK
jgi:hypothetical protein